MSHGLQHQSQCRSWFPAQRSINTPSSESTRVLKHTRSSKRLCMCVCVCVCVYTHIHPFIFSILQLLHCPKFCIEIDTGYFQDLDQILTSRNQINFRQCLGSTRGQSTQKRKPIPVRARWILSRQTYWPHIGSAQMHTLEHAPHTHTHTGACTHIHTHTHFGPGCHKT